MGDEEDRDAIFRRRQKLIALALAGLATTGCDKIKELVSPQPCLSQVAPDPCLSAPIEDPRVDPPPCLSPTLDMIPATMDPVPDPGPTPCLEPPMPEPDEVEETPTAMETTTMRTSMRSGMRGDPEASPRPCLSVARPAPCLVPPE